MHQPVLYPTKIQNEVVFDSEIKLFRLDLLPSSEFSAPLLSHVFGISQEWMIYEHLCSPAPFHLLVEALVDEVLEIGRPRLFDSRWLFLYDVEDHTRLVLINVGRFAHGKFMREDAERPDIDLVVVRFFTAN